MSYYFRDVTRNNWYFMYLSIFLKVATKTTAMSIRKKSVSIQKENLTSNPL